jgi:hypothetical protein
MKNNYIPYESKWSLKDWQNYCPNLQYRVVKQGEFPPFLPSGLTSKFNCGMVVASGSSTNQTFVFQGYRVDGLELDEHQYIVSYDLPKSESYAGFVEHADYNGRTTDVPAQMQLSMSLSGVNIDFEFPRKPPAVSGSIDDLIAKNLIKGFTNSVEVQSRNKSS